MDIETPGRRRAEFIRGSIFIFDIVGYRHE